MKWEGDWKLLLRSYNILYNINTVASLSPAWLTHPCVLAHPGHLTHAGRWQHTFPGVGVGHWSLLGSGRARGHHVEATTCGWIGSPQNRWHLCWWLPCPGSHTWFRGQCCGVCVWYVKCSFFWQNLQRWLYTRCNLLWLHSFYYVHNIVLLLLFFFLNYVIILLLIGTQSVLNPKTKKLSIFCVYRCMHGAPTQWVSVVRGTLCHPSWGLSVWQGWMCQFTKSVPVLLTLLPGLPFPLTGNNITELPSFILL